MFTNYYIDIQDWYNISSKINNTRNNVLSNNDELILDQVVLPQMLRCAQIKDQRRLTVRFSTCATDIIKQIFDRYKDYLIITSKIEHESVYKSIDGRQALFLDWNDIKHKQFQQILQYIKNTQNRKIIFYVGQINFLTGQEVPNDLYKSFRHFALCNDIETIIVNDAVQQMFVGHCITECCDYIIGTAHSLIPKFNLGIVFCTKNNTIGFSDTYSGLEYITKLIPISQYTNKILSFSDYIAQLLATQFSNRLDNHSWIYCSKITDNDYVSLKQLTKQTIHNSEIHLNMVCSQPVLRIRGTGPIYNRPAFESTFAIIYKYFRKE